MDTINKTRIPIKCNELIKIGYQQNDLALRFQILTFCSLKSWSFDFLFSLQFWPCLRSWFDFDSHYVLFEVRNRPRNKLKRFEYRLQTFVLCVNGINLGGCLFVTSAGILATSQKACWSPEQCSRLIDTHPRHVFANNNLCPRYKLWGRRWLTLHIAVHCTLHCTAPCVSSPCRKDFWYDRGSKPVKNIKKLTKLRGR